jgi:hypothetical protein
MRARRISKKEYCKGYALRCPVVSDYLSPNPPLLASKFLANARFVSDL